MKFKFEFLVLIVTMKSFTIIAACDSKYGLSKNGELPWKNTAIGKADMSYFKYTTIMNNTRTILPDGSIGPGVKNAVVMGRKTYESIPKEFFPLKDRVNIILSKNYNNVIRKVGQETVIECNSLKMAIYLCYPYEKIFICGGAALYEEAIQHPACNDILLTMIPGDYECDLFFPIDKLSLYNKQRTFVHSEGAVDPINLSISYYGYRNPYEKPFVGILKECLSKYDSGLPQDASLDVKSYGGINGTVKFPLIIDGVNIIPMITTNEVYFRAIFYELIWQFRERNTVRHEYDTNVHLWSEDGLIDISTLRNYRIGNGRDQYLYMIDHMKEAPTTRRHVISLFDKYKLDQVVDPPTKITFQMYVKEVDEKMLLTCKVSIQSLDAFLGLPFVIATYGLLTHMTAFSTGFIPHEVIINMGEYHIYESQVQYVREQVTRSSRRFPKLTVNNVVTGDISETKFEDINVDNYVSHRLLRVPGIVVDDDDNKNNTISN